MDQQDITKGDEQRSITDEERELIQVRWYYVLWLIIPVYHVPEFFSFCYNFLKHLREVWWQIYGTETDYKIRLKCEAQKSMVMLL